MTNVKAVDGSRELKVNVNKYRKHLDHLVQQTKVNSKFPVAGYVKNAKMKGHILKAMENIGFIEKEGLGKYVFIKKEFLDHDIIAIHRECNRIATNYSRAAQERKVKQREALKAQQEEEELQRQIEEEERLKSQEESSETVENPVEEKVEEETKETKAVEAVVIEKKVPPITPEMQSAVDVNLQVKLQLTEAKLAESEANLKAAYAKLETLQGIISEFQDGMTLRDGYIEHLNKKNTSYLSKIAKG